MPMIRAANTGISAMIDSAGRVRAMLDLGTIGHLDVAMPARMTVTPYSLIGDIGLLGLLLFITVVCLLCRRMKMFCVPNVFENWS